MKSRVLVTGGAGFIGSHLVSLLLERGYEVTVLDDFSTGKYDNIPLNHASVSVLSGDLSDQTALESALRDQDAFVHLAAIASVEASVQDPIRTHRTNLEGSIRLFEAAANLGVRRAVYASSAAVYGNNAEIPLKETATPRPLTPYAVDKLAGEHYLDFFHRANRLDATAFRFFNVFGPRQDPSSPYSGVISIFLDRATKTDPITVFGDGKQTRDFVYVKDVALALFEAIERAERPDELPVFNVGQGKAVSLLDLLNTIERLPGVHGPLEVRHAEPRQGDIRASLSDVSKLTATGWEPATNLFDGLLSTVGNHNG